MKMGRTAACLCAAVLVCGLAGCKGSEDKDKNKNSLNDSSAVISETVTQEPQPQVQAVRTAKDGKYIMQAYQFLQSETYSIKIGYTDHRGNNESIYRVVDGGNYYQLERNDIGCGGSIFLDGSGYDFDLVCGVYKENRSKRPESLIESVVEQDLPATSTHIDPIDAQKYAVEEYTYTGGTFITVMDFYFDRDCGLPVKYVTHYMVEEENGDESREEVRYIRDIYPKAFFGLPEDAVIDAQPTGGEDISTDGEDFFDMDITTDSQDGSQDIDRSVFDISFLDKLMDFDDMTGEQKQGFCTAIFVTAGVSTEELTGAGFNDESLKNISFDDFVSLVYEYGYDE
ncbi:MAG: hypothetical protein IJ806_08155 [Ruminococcus sp.]|nr:hypothetical protein [Ruminococcus sp.]